MLKPQLLSFGNLFPLSPICVLNKAKEYQSLRVANAAEQLLQIHAGNVECGMLTRDKAPVDSTEYNARRSISIDDLQFQLEQLKDVSKLEEAFVLSGKISIAASIWPVINIAFFHAIRPALIGKSFCSTGSLR